MASRSRTSIILCWFDAAEDAKDAAGRMRIVPLDRTWRWRVSHGDMVEILEALEPIAAKSAPQLRRLKYVVSGPDDIVDFTGELQRALHHVTDPFSVEVRYSDVGRTLDLGAFFISVVVHKRRTSRVEVARSSTSPRSRASRRFVQASAGWRMPRPSTASSV